MFRFTCSNRGDCCKGMRHLYNEALDNPYIASFFAVSDHPGFLRLPHTLILSSHQFDLNHLRLNLPTATDPLAWTIHAFITHGDPLLPFLLLHMLAHPQTRTTTLEALQ